MIPSGTERGFPFLHRPCPVFAGSERNRPALGERALQAPPQMLPARRGKEIPVPLVEAGKFLSPVHGCCWAQAWPRCTGRPAKDSLALSPSKFTLRLSPASSLALAH